MLLPKIKKENFLFKQCAKCGGTFGEENYIKTSSPFYDGYIPICMSCLNEWL